MKREGLHPSGLSDSYISRNWTQCKNPTFVGKHMLGRTLHLIAAPTALINAAISTILGLGAIIYTTLQPRHAEKALNFRRACIIRAGECLILSYKNMVQAVNPSITFLSKTEADAFYSRDGLATKITLGCFEKIFGLFNIKKSDTFFRRHICSRFFLLSLMTTIAIGRLSDGILSIPLVSLSLLSGGKISSINALAIRTIRFPVLILETAGLIGFTLRPGELIRR